MAGWCAAAGGANSLDAGVLDGAGEPVIRLELQVQHGRGTVHLVPYADAQRVPGRAQLGASPALVQAARQLQHLRQNARLRCSGKAVLLGLSRAFEAQLE